MIDQPDLPGVQWRRVIVDLEERGWSHGGIACTLGVSRTAILSWKNSSVEPLHQKGERLILLWCALMAAKREDVPRAQRQLDRAAQLGASRAA